MFVGVLNIGYIYLSGTGGSPSRAKCLHAHVRPPHITKCPLLQWDTADHRGIHPLYDPGVGAGSCWRAQCGHGRPGGSVGGHRGHTLAVGGLPVPGRPVSAVNRSCVPENSKPGVLTTMLLSSSKDIIQETLIARLLCMDEDSSCNIHITLVRS